MHIRKRVNSDIEKLSEILSTVYHNDGYPVEGPSDSWSWLHPDLELESFVAIAHGEIVGQVSIVAPDAAIKVAIGNSVMVPFAVLSRLFVSPNARNLGAGSALIKEAHKWAFINRMNLALEVLDKDESAIRLYRRLGWKEIKKSRHIHGDKYYPSSYFLSSIASRSDTP